MADNATLARTLYEAWNERDFDRMVEMVPTEGQIVIVGSGDTFDGPEGAMQYNKMWADAFPDGVITIDRMHEAGDCVIVELTGRGTHTGTLVTSMGSIPATGRSLTLQLCDVIEFRDGKPLSQRTYFDTGSLMAQLGLTETQAATTTPQ
jgi:steroid delta-isomerase-like uncharacterized protein